MPRVKFNMVTEFAEEIKKDAEHIDRNIVRVTQSFKQSELSPKIKLVYFIGTYSVDGQVVKLERYCGDVWGVSEDADKVVLDKADMAMGDVEKLCKALGIDCRAGILEDGDNG